jgi:arylsulfatase A-like enzyme
MLRAMPRRVLIALPLLLLLAAAGAATWLRHTPQRQPLHHRPPNAQASAATNVVLVIGCTTRAEHTTPYGAPTHVSPFLEQLAQQGTRFAFALAQAPWTRPAVAAILTSRHPSAIGLTEPGPSLNRRHLPDAVTTLAERMRASGRTTFGLAANPNTSAAFGFAQGFDHYWDGPNPWHGPAPTVVSGGQVVEEALDMLAMHEAGDGGPFYLQLVLIDAHGPDRGNTQWIDELRYLEPGLPRRVARYRARVKRLDSAMEQLDAGLVQLGYDEANTLWVFIADHGEGLRHPEHHGIAHGQFLYPSALGIPWILRGPGVAGGHVVPGIAAQIDLMPTVLGVLGLPAPDEVVGHDWSQQVAGRRDRTTREVAFAETWFSRSERVAVYSESAHCQIDFREHQTRADRERLHPPEHASFRSGCFDLGTDPDSTRPVDNPELLSLIAPFHARQLLLRAHFGEAGKAPIDPGIERQLEALGYTD